MRSGGRDSRWGSGQPPRSAKLMKVAGEGWLGAGKHGLRWIGGRGSSCLPGCRPNWLAASGAHVVKRGGRAPQDPACSGTTKHPLSKQVQWDSLGTGASFSGMQQERQPPGGPTLHHLPLRHYARGSAAIRPFGSADAPSSMLCQTTAGCRAPLLCTMVALYYRSPPAAPGLRPAHLTYSTRSWGGAAGLEKLVRMVCSGSGSSLPSPFWST